MKFRHEISHIFLFLGILFALCFSCRYGLTGESVWSVSKICFTCIPAPSGSIVTNFDENDFVNVSRYICVQNFPLTQHLKIKWLIAIGLNMIESRDARIRRSRPFNKEVSLPSRVLATRCFFIIIIFFNKKIILYIQARERLSSKKTLVWYWARVCVCLLVRIARELLAVAANAFYYQRLYRDIQAAVTRGLFYFIFIFTG